MTTVKEGPTVYPEDIECVVDSVNGKGGIFISNVEAAQNPLTLKKHGIKAILTAAINIDLKHSKCDVPLYKKVPGQDHENFDLSKYFEEAVVFIKESLKATNILVHCMAGVSRSVSLVLAYLIKEKSMSYDESYTLVKGRRKIIYPNEGFIKQLRKFEKQCRQTKQKLNTTIKYDQPKKSPIRISEQFKTILAKYDSPSKTLTPIQFDQTEKKYNTNNFSSNLHQSPTRPSLKQYFQHSPTRKTTLDYSPLKEHNVYSSPRKTYGNQYKINTLTPTAANNGYQNMQQLEKKVESIRKKYANKISDFTPYKPHLRTKSYIDGNEFRGTYKTQPMQQLRNSPSKLPIWRNHY